MAMSHGQTTIVRVFELVLVSQQTLHTAAVPTTDFLVEL
jgi:hypothetical protein